MQEARVADPAALLDEFAVHQGDLTSWATEAEPAYRRPHARGFRQTDGVVGCLLQKRPRSTGAECRSWVRQCWKLRVSRRRPAHPAPFEKHAPDPAPCRCSRSG